VPALAGSEDLLGDLFAVHWHILVNMEKAANVREEAMKKFGRSTEKCGLNTVMWCHALLS